MSDELENCINNYINGNLSDAKRQAKRFKLDQIREGLRDYCGYGFQKASLTAEWLKGLSDNRQAACDCE